MFRYWSFSNLKLPISVIDYNETRIKRTLTKPERVYYVYYVYIISLDRNHIIMDILMEKADTCLIRKFKSCVRFRSRRF